MGERHAPAALPPEKTRYPLYRRLGGPQGRSGRVLKILPLPGFDHRTVQSVASRYIDCAIPAHTRTVTLIIYILSPRAQYVLIEDVKIQMSRQCSRSKPKQNTAQSPVPNVSSSSLEITRVYHVAKFNACGIV